MVDNLSKYSNNIVFARWCNFKCLSSTLCTKNKRLKYQHLMFLNVWTNLCEPKWWIRLASDPCQEWKERILNLWKKKTWDGWSYHWIEIFKCSSFPWINPAFLHDGVKWNCWTPSSLSYHLPLIHPKHLPYTPSRSPSFSHYLSSFRVSVVQGRISSHVKIFEITSD